LASVTLSIPIDGTVSIDTNGNYVVPKSFSGTDIVNINPDPISLSTVPISSGNSQDNNPPISTLWIEPNESGNTWPRIITIIASDNIDNDPIIYYSFDNEPLSTSQYSGNSPGKIYLSINKDTTISYFAADSNGNFETIKRYTLQSHKIQIEDLNYPPNSIVHPGTNDQKKWKITNSGTTKIYGLKAIMSSGAHQLNILQKTISISELDINESYIISIPFSVPDTNKMNRNIQHWLLRDESYHPIEVNDSENAEFCLDVISYGTPTNTFKFADIQDSSDLDSLIYEYGVANNIIKPPSMENQWCFRPFDDIKRGEFVKMLVAALKEPFNTSGEPFEDVLSNHDLFQYIQTAKNLGWARGYNGLSFGPDNPMIHYEMALFLHRASGWGNSIIDGSLYPDIPASPPTDYSSSLWEEIYQAINALKTHNVLLTANENFNLEKNLSRVDALMLIQRFANSVSNNHSVLPTINTQVNYTIHDKETVDLKAIGTVCNSCTPTFKWLSLNGGQLVIQENSQNNPNTIKWIPPIVSTTKQFEVQCLLYDGMGYMTKELITITVSHDDTIPSNNPVSDVINPSVSINISPLNIYLDEEISIRWSAFDNHTVQGDLKIEIQYLKGNSINDIDLNAENTGIKKWKPLETGELKIRISAIDESGNRTDWAYSETINVFQSEMIEAPNKPYILPLPVSSISPEVKLQWRKVNNSKNRLNADYYEIRYSTNNDFSNAQNITNIIDNSNPNNMYAINTYTVINLNDDTRYYFQVRAINDSGISFWSDTSSILIDIPDTPDKAYDPSPSNNAINISKTPVLSWKAKDKDINDLLDFSVYYGLTADNLYLLRSYKAGENQGVQYFDFKTEYHKPLPPNTLIYWKIDTRDQLGHQVEGDLWQFKTENIGDDLQILNAVLTGDLIPYAKAEFTVTIKNNGTEISNQNFLRANYVKNLNDSPFWSMNNTYIPEINPGETISITPELKFQDHIIHDNSTDYDNILICGESAIRFYFAINDEQDKNLDNNQFDCTVQYENAGGPVIESFELRAIGDYHDNSLFVVPGRVLGIFISAKDDIKTDRAYIEYRTNISDDWNLIKEFLNNPYQWMVFTYSDAHGNIQGSENYYEWQLPEDIELTDEAEIRIRLFDDNNVETIEISKPFSIRSNKLEITNLQTDKVEYQVGENAQLSISLEQSCKITSFYLYLYAGNKRTYYESKDITDGIDIQPTYTLTIPDDNSFVSDSSYFEIIIGDENSNIIRVKSINFKVTSDTSLPRPFKNYTFLLTGEITYSGILVDNNNIAHVLLTNTLGYNSEQHYIKVNLDDNSIISSKTIPTNDFIQLDSYSLSNDRIIAVFRTNLNSNDVEKKFYYAIKDLSSNNFSSVVPFDSCSGYCTKYSIGFNIDTNYYVVTTEYNSQSSLFYRIYPSFSQLGNFSNDYAGEYLHVSGNYLSTGWKKIYLINDSNTNKNPILTISVSSSISTPYYYNYSSSLNIAGYRAYKTGGNFGLIVDNQHNIIELPQLNGSAEAIFEFEDEFIISEINSSDTHYRIVRIDKSDHYKYSIYSLGKELQFNKIQKVTHINRNKLLGVLFKHGTNMYITSADLSGDSIPPTITITNNNFSFEQGIPGSITWTMSDNNNDISKIEIIKVINDVENILSSAADSSLTEFEYNFIDDTEEVEIKVAVYDSSGNVGFDTVTFNKVIPFKFMSFKTNKEEYDSNEYIEFNWNSTGDHSTSYQISHKEVSKSDWSVLTTTTISGSNTLSYSLSDFIEGEYNFKISSNDKELIMLQTISIQNTNFVFSFNHDQFSTSGEIYTTNNVFDLSWADNVNYSESVVYSLLIKKQNETNFVEVSQTSDKHYTYKHHDVSPFHYRISTIYDNKTYLSNSFSVTPKALISPSITNITITDSPSVNIYFDIIDGISEYLIYRKEPNNTFNHIDSVSSGYFHDTNVTYSSSYQYQIVSKYGDKNSIPIEIKQVDIQQEPVINHLFFTIENGVITQDNSIILEYSVSPSSSYHNYSVYLGTAAYDLKPYTQTNNLYCSIKNLQFSETYYSRIDSIDRNGVVSASSDIFIFSTLE